MGTWGVAVFSDDLAADLRDEFRDLIGEGLSSTEAVDKLLGEYASSLEDDNEKSVFWIVLAAVQWKLGRLEERTKKVALSLIAAGEDLKRWDDPKDRKKRAAILEKVREQLLSTQPPAKRVARTIKAANDWTVGEVVGLQLKSGNWTLLRVIGHHEDKGGRHAVCELLDWVGKEFPLAGQVAKLPIKCESTAPDPNSRALLRRIAHAVIRATFRRKTPRGTSQFMFQDPITGKDRARVKRLGLRSRPAQRCGGYSVLVWPYVDKLLKELFGLE